MELFAVLGYFFTKNFDIAPELQTKAFSTPNTRMWPEKSKYMVYMEANPNVDHTLACHAIHRWTLCVTRIVLCLWTYGIHTRDIEHVENTVTQGFISLSSEVFNQSHSLLASIVSNIVTFGGGLQLNKYKIFTRGFWEGAFGHYIAKWQTCLKLSLFLKLRFFIPPDYWKRFLFTVLARKMKNLPSVIRTIQWSSSHVL